MDRFSELEVFTSIIEQGSFTDAARKLGLSKSVVSKQITALEARLGVTLLNRTTRQVQPTEIGEEFYRQSKSVLSNLQLAEEYVSSQQSTIRGKLRITAANDFGVNQLADPVSKFLCEHSDVKIEMKLENQFVDIVAENFDLAFRIGNLSDSSLKARKIAETQTSVLASPDYIKKHGAPRSLAEIVEHDVLQYSNMQGESVWRVSDSVGQIQHIPINANFTVNDGKSLLKAAIAGVGLTILPCFVYTEALKSGQLVKILPEFEPATMGVYIVYPPSDYIPPKTRAFIDFMVTAFKGKGMENW